MHKMALGALFFGICFLGQAFAVNVTVVQPTELQAITSGEPLEVEFNSDTNIVSISILLAAVGAGEYSENSLRLFTANYPGSAGVRGLKKSFDTTGIVDGQYDLIIHVGPVGLPSTVRTIRVAFLPDDGAGEAPVVVVRYLPEFIYPNGYFAAGIGIFPKNDFPGIIISDNVPSDLDIITWGFPASATSYENFILEGAEKKTFKVVGMNSNRVTTYTYAYGINVPAGAEPGDVFEFDGNWSIEGASGTVIGDSSITVAGLRIPNCPVSDEQLLAFITRWANTELSNGDILQIVERYVWCQTHAQAGS